MNEEYVYRLAIVICFWCAAVILFAVNSATSWRLWKEALKKGISLTEDGRLALKQGLRSSGAILLIYVGLVIIEPKWLAYWHIASVAALLFGLSSYLGIRRRQKIASNRSASSVTD